MVAVATAAVQEPDESVPEQTRFAGHAALPQTIRLLPHVLNDGTPVQTQLARLLRRVILFHYRRYASRCKGKAK